MLEIFIYHDTNLGYIDLLLKATDFKPQRWNDLLSIYDEVDPDIRKKIKEKLLFEIAQMDDDERLIIKNNIRRVVYKHRYFASAEWAMGEDLIGEMLDILDSINFTQQEYDFEYLFRPSYDAEMVSIIFRHDGDDPEERKTEEFRNYAQVIHRLFDMAKFCPCEENGTVSYDEIKVWVDKLIRILDSNHQKEMFGYVLGRLFAYAPKTADGHYPCEAVCQIIEEYGDESLLSEYRCELFNKREIFSPSAGRAEKDIAEGYKDNAEFLSIKYPKTADVFFKMSQSYVYDSDLERRRAENGYF